MYKKDRQIPVEKIKFQISAIWYNLYNLKKMRSTHGRVLLLVKLQASACDFNKKHSSIVPSPPRFSNFTNGAKSRSVSYINAPIFSFLPGFSFNLGALIRWKRFTKRRIERNILNIEMPIYRNQSNDWFLYDGNFGV